jgi:hypothetical protein
VPKRTGKYGAEFRQRMLEQIRQVLAAEGYVLNSTEYVNNRTKLHITCPIGHQWHASWDTIRANKRCGQCYKEGVQKARLNKKRKPKGWEEHRVKMYLRFRAELEAEGYTVHTDAYVNNRQKFAVTCKRGHKWSVCWNSWSSGKRCRECWIEDSRLTQEEVSKILEASGCELLSPYKGIDQPFKYRCSCGRISRIRLHDFRQGHRCSACGAEKARITLRKKRLLRLQHLNHEYPNVNA